MYALAWLGCVQYNSVYIIASRKLRMRGKLIHLSIGSARLKNSLAARAYYFGADNEGQQQLLGGRSFATYFLNHRNASRVDSLTVPYTHSAF